MKSTIKVNGNNISKDTLKFSAGEVQIRLGSLDVLKPNLSVEASLRCSDGVMLLLQLASIINRKGSNNRLHLSYMPYSRYDRTEEINDALSLKVFAGLVNSMGFSSVTTDDCHSDVGIALIDGCRDIPQYVLALALVDDIDSYDAIVAPDANACKKSYKLSQKLGIPLIECSKKRDFKTGRITGFQIGSVENIFKVNKILIVDDICDGGGTFIGLTVELKKHFRQVDLYVSNGIFSKGVDILKQAGIENIYAWNDWINSDKVVAFQKG